MPPARAEGFGMSAIAEPASTPRKTSLNTRIVKNEFGAATKDNSESVREEAVSNFCVAEPLPFSWFKSIFITMLPLAAIIFSNVPVWLCRLFCSGSPPRIPPVADWVAESPSAVAGLPKSKSNGNAKTPARTDRAIRTRRLKKAESEADFVFIRRNGLLRADGECPFYREGRQHVKHFAIFRRPDAMQPLD